MPIHSYFPTLVYTAALQRRGTREAQCPAPEECRQLRADDASGRRWSAANYPGGYTSYASAHRLQRVSPTFAELERKLARHVQAFAAAVEWDLAGRAAVDDRLLGQHHAAAARRIPCTCIPSRP